jgi:hypothetical protein
MPSKSFRILAWTLLSSGLLLAACKGTGESAPAKPQAETPPIQAAPTTTVEAVDACTLLTQAEVEAAVGRTVLAPQKEEVPQFSVCGYGDPQSPVVSGRALTQLVKISVMVGSDASYYAGGKAQAKDSFETFKNNAASPQEVTGLGNAAYWDATFSSLTVLDGQYLVEVEIAADAGGLDAAKGLATKVLVRLP